EREIGGDHALGGEPGLDVAAGYPAEFAVPAAFLGECLGFADTGEAFPEGGVGVGDALAGLVVGDGGALPEPEGGGDHGDEHGGGGERERDVHQGHGDGDTEQG